MTSKGAVRVARIKFKQDFEDVEETNQRIANVIDGLKQAEKDLEILEILKHIILGIEETFNQKEFNESGVLGTIIKDYFINNDITGKVEERLNEGREKYEQIKK